MQRMAHRALLPSAGLRVLASPDADEQAEERNNWAGAAGWA